MFFTVLHLTGAVIFAASNQPRFSFCDIIAEVVCRQATTATRFTADSTITCENRANLSCANTLVLYLLGMIHTLTCLTHITVVWEWQELLPMCLTLLAHGSGALLFPLNFNEGNPAL